MILLKRITNKINNFFRLFINRKNQKHLTNQDITVISSNCTGGFILHDLSLRFNSPFVNLYLSPKDFIHYLQNINFYQKQPLNFIQTDKKYPVAKLSDITIHFMHYHNEQEAQKKWQERTQRMNLNRLFIIMIERDGCTLEDLIKFDQLPFKNKIVFTHKDYPEIQSSFKITGFEQFHQVGDVFDYMGLNGKRYYDQFDYVNWFNKN